MENETENAHRPRRRSATRLKFDAETQIFKKQVGDLEDIRKNLGLRPAQMARLLKVHPSAWIRWTHGEQAPPHVYQMLAWYLELENYKKYHSNPATQSPAPSYIAGLSHQPVGNPTTPNLFPRPEKVLAEESYTANFGRILNPENQPQGVGRALIATWIFQVLMIAAFALYAHGHFH